MDIREIESLCEEWVAKHATESTEVKGYMVYFIDLGGYFGKSAMVFANGMNINHAHDYQLHHPTMDDEELRDWYVRTMRNKLFTREELVSLCPSYDEEQRRLYNIANVYSQRRPYVSIWGDKDEEWRETYGFTHYSECAFAWYRDEAFRDELDALFEEARKACEESHDADYMRKAFAYQMSNFEYGLSMDKDYEVIDCFQKVRYIPYGTTEEYLAETGWSDEWKDAYREAKRMQYRAIDEYMSAA